MKRVALTTLKIVFFAGIFLFVILTVLTKLGGQSEVMRDTIEDYITENTPYSAHVGTLNGMYFFPDITIDIGAVELRDASNKTAITADRFRLSFAFFDLLFSRRRFRDLHVENMVAGPGVLMPRALIVKQAGVDETDEKGSVFAFYGVMGEAPFSGFLGVHAEGSPARRIYSFNESWPVDLQLADLSVKGRMQHDAEGDLTLSEITLGQGDTIILTGTLDILREGLKRFIVKGDLKTPEDTSILHPDVILGFAPFSMQGRMTADQLRAEDFTRGGAMDAFIQSLVARATGIERASLWGVMAASTLDLDLDIKSFTAMGRPWGTLSTKLKSEDYILSTEALKGEIAGGALDGEIRLNIQKPPFRYYALLNLHDAGLNALLGQESNAEDAPQYITARLELSREDSDIETLQSGPAQGKLTIIGNQLNLSETALTPWLEGFESGLLPAKANGQALALSCVIADFDIADHKAQAASLYAQSPVFVMRGNGAYDIAADQADFALESRAASAGVSATRAFHVLGPLNALSVQPARFDAGGSGLASDARSLQDTSITLTGITLAADHPCRSVVIEQEILAPPDDTQGETLQIEAGEEIEIPPPEAQEGTADMMENVTP